MKAPKLLPWIARKAGISDALALKIWRRAAAEAENVVGNAQSSEYFATLMDRFLTLIEVESGTPSLPQTEQTAWMWRYQRRMATHSLILAQSAARWWQNLAAMMWPMVRCARRAHCR